MTEDGFKEYEKVIEYIFAAIKNVKSQIFDKNVYKEESLLSYMNFLYKGKPSVSSNLIDFALNMKKIPLNLLLVADEVYMDFQPKEIEEIYNALTIDKSLILLGSDTFKLPGETARFKRVRNMTCGSHAHKEPLPWSDLALLLTFSALFSVAVDC